MTVKELIEELNKLPADMDVVGIGTDYSGDTFYFSPSPDLHKIRAYNVPGRDDATINDGLVEVVTLGSG